MTNLERIKELLNSVENENQRKQLLLNIINELEFYLDLPFTKKIIEEIEKEKELPNDPH